MFPIHGIKSISTPKELYLTLKIPFSFTQYNLSNAVHFDVRQKNVLCGTGLQAWPDRLSVLYFVRDGAALYQ
jgi:hypothetical protein